MAMASQGFRDWVKAGKPYALIRPARALQSNVRRHGIVVYDYPNDAHLTASTPEDHTPFSVTGFPGPNARWNARGLDIMPRSGSAAHRAENAAIARQLIRDRNAGVPGAMWIKYINWTAENGDCQQDRWTPNHTTRASSDSGHIHVSGRSDVDDDDRADLYDPVLRLQVGAQIPPTGGIMGLTPEQQNDLWVWIAAQMDPNTPATGRTDDRFHFPPPFRAVNAKLDALAATLGEIKAAIAAIPATGSAPTSEQWRDLTAEFNATIERLFAEKVGAAAKAGAEEALREVRLTIDSTVPPPA